MELLQLPPHCLEEILNLLGDAKDIIRAQSVCKALWSHGDNVRSVSVVVLNRYHEWARRSKEMGSLASGGKPSTEGFFEGVTDAPETPSTFKHQTAEFLKKKLLLEQLRLEIEPALQAKSVSENERRRNDFWLSDPAFLKQWVQCAGSNLKHLCVIDYGQQAIMRNSSILKILSQSCKHLKTLDLRNMFIDTSDYEIMPSMISLKLRCVKVTGSALQDINAAMPRLQTLALLGIFGAEGGNLFFEHMSVLCLGLSTHANEVKMYLPALTKLQLKMVCPKDLCIRAPVLKCVAFNLEVTQTSTVELFCLNEALETTITSTAPIMKANSSSYVEGQRENNLGLLELLYGASSFTTLSNLLLSNPNLRKIYLDIPCMALADDGRFLGVLKNVQLNLPRFSHLHSCRDLKVLNVGPGFWHCMETNVETLSSEEAWPSMEELILHLIPHNLKASAKVLSLLLRPSVISVIIYIHTSSPVTSNELEPIIQEQVTNCEQDIKLEILPWTKSLDFSCFSF